MKIIKKYKYTLLFGVCLCGLIIGWPETGTRALLITLEDAKTILAMLPPVLILVGLFDVWVPKETVIRYMGESSGVKGVAFAFILGTVAAGPLFVAFPIAAMLASKGARLANILFFLGIWTTAKLPLILFEISFLGGYFTLIHVSVGVLMFLLGSFVIERLAPDSSIHSLRLMAKNS